MVPETVCTYDIFFSFFIFSFFLFRFLHIVNYKSVNSGLFPRTNYEGII